MNGEKVRYTTAVADQISINPIGLLATTNAAMLSSANITTDGARLFPDSTASVHQIQQVKWAAETVNKILIATRY